MSPFDRPLGLSRPVAVGLALLLAWSFAVRAWYGSAELSARRYWDERYSLENVQSILETGSLRPANGYHPSLSYLPQAGLLAASHLLYRMTDAETWRVLKDQPRRGQEPDDEEPDQRSAFTPTAYFLSRLLQAVFGTASLWLLFVIGCRLFSQETALISTVVLSGVFWHLRQSAIFKPDILLVLLVLLAFHLSLRAASNPSRNAYAAAGGAIGLVLASKFNGGPIALPLIVAALLGYRNDRRTAVWLILAGIISIAVFLLLNPYLLLDSGLFVQDFSRTLRNYAAKGATQESSHLQVLWHGVATLLSTNLLGRVLGAAGLVGCITIVAAPAERSIRVGRWMALSYIIGYSLIYAASTTNLSPHNWLPVTPFIALFAAALLWTLWSLTTQTFPGSRQPLVVVPLATLLVFAWLYRQMDFAYPMVVPTTEALAEAHLRRRISPVRQKVVYHEPLAGRLNIRGGNDSATSVAVERLSAVGHEGLNRADAELFHLASQGHEDERDFLQQRIDTFADRNLRRFEPSWFRARGPGLAVLVHRWRRRGEPLGLRRVDLEDDMDAVSIVLPPSVEAGAMASLEARVPAGHQIASMSVDGEPLTFARMGERRIYGSVRFLVPAPRAVVNIALEPGTIRKGPSGRQLSLILFRWTHRRFHPPPTVDETIEADEEDDS